MDNYNSNEEKLGLIENRNVTFNSKIFAIIFTILMLLVLIFSLLNFF
jgi:hypothetical protein